ncbi:hypothetical protein LguiA_031494 [Lonicera macranthoides]
MIRAMPLDKIKAQGNRDEFIAYLRGEFAAANVIIDSMCHHLRSIGKPGEYDDVIKSIQQRRFYWDQIIRMQPYFTVAGILHELKQVIWRRQQRFYGLSNRQGQWVDLVKKGQNLEKDSGSEKGGEDNNLDLTVVEQRNGSPNVDLENDFPSLQTSTEKQNISIAAAGTEMFDGKAVNVVDEMELVSELVTLVNDLRASGTRGHFQVSKRPTTGNGGEMIQLVLRIADTPLEDEATSKTSKDHRIEHVAALMQDFAERLIASQVVTVKPDSCIIDVYSEGDHSQPRIWPHWYGRPVCALFLTESEMTFSKVYI